MMSLPTGRSVLHEVLVRVKKVPSVDGVVVAIPDTDPNNLLACHASRFPNVAVYRGSEQDVLARFHGAMGAGGNSKRIMRITADCPLLDAETCQAVIDAAETYDADYVSNAWPTRMYPHGWDCEVFTPGVLDRAHREATEPYDREHVTPWMQRCESLSRVGLKSIADRSMNRWTLDTLDDYTRICAVMGDR